MRNRLFLTTALVASLLAFWGCDNKSNNNKALEKGAKVYEDAYKAFNDYVTRTKINSAYHGSSKMKMTVLEFYGTHNRLPKNSELETGYQLDMDGESIDYRYSAPTITATFTSDSKLKNQTITITLEPKANGIVEISCGGSLPLELLPSSCRPY